MQTDLVRFWRYLTRPFAGLSVLTAALVGTFGGRLAAADNRERFEARVHESPAGGQLPYRLLKPKEYDAARKYPLVVFLHGAGERGNDNKRQLIHGMNDFASDEIMTQYPCFVLAPQCPHDGKWANVNWSAAAHTMTAEPAAALRMTMEVIEKLEKEFSVDRQRLYITGLSMGGYGTWDAIQRYPERFAAAAPVCGGGDPAGAKRFAKLPLWAFHGADDGVVKPQRSREMIEALKAAGGSPKYTEYPKTGHDSWTATYRNPEFYAWLFAQKRSAPEK